jgi:hypothetical protein
MQERFFVHSGTIGLHAHVPEERDQLDLALMVMPVEPLAAGDAPLGVVGHDLLLVAGEPVSGTVDVRPELAPSCFS